MDKFPVMEHFYTIQGEGMHSGTAAYFIRLGGCDVGCVWCDVKESWDANVHPQMSTHDLIEILKEVDADTVVLTGGEPAMYDLTNLVEGVKLIGKKVHIETSGAYPILGNFDWITFSPKKFKAPIATEVQKADELKVVVFNKSDFKWAELYAEQVNENCKLYLQPEWSKEKQMAAEIVEYVKEHPQWKISLQTHKYLNIP